MQPFTTAAPTDDPHAAPAAAPDRPPQATPPQSPTAPHPAIAPDRPTPQTLRTGPLRSGNPRGNPNLAPRCGAKARTTGRPCQAPAMPNGRCRMHGGKSTGPRTPEGFANLAKTHTTHGLYAQTGPEAELRLEIHDARIVARHGRLHAAAYDHLPWLPPQLAARLRAGTATELQTPKCDARLQPAPATTAPTDQPTAPSTLTPPTRSPRRDASGRFAPPPPRPLRGRKAERARARAEAAALAPWKLAIAHARIARRPGTHPAPNAQSENPRRNAMQREAPPHTTAPAHAEAGNRAKTPMQRGTVTHPPQAAFTPDIQFENPRRNAMHREAPPHTTAPAHAEAGNRAKTPMQRGTVTHPPQAAFTPDIQFENPRRNAMHREAPPQATAPPHAAADNRAKTPMQRGTVRRPPQAAAAPNAQFENPRRNAMQRETPPQATAPPHAAADNRAKTPMQRGTVRRPPQPGGSTTSKPPHRHTPSTPAATHPNQPARQQPGKHPIHPGTVRKPEGPFRRALLSGTVSNTRDAHKLAALVRRAGGWPVILAIDAAKTAGQDGRAAGAAACQRLADDAARHRPLCIRLKAPEPDPARTVRTSGARSPGAHPSGVT